MRKISHAGFTLLEVLIAITLLALLMLSVYSIVDSSTTTKEKVTAEDRDFLQVEAFFARFDTDFSQIYSPLYFSTRAQQTTAPSDGSVSYTDETSSSSERFEGKAENGLPIPNVNAEGKGKLIFLTSSNRRRIVGAKESDYAWISYEMKNAAEENKLAPFVIVRNYQAQDVYAKSFKWDETKDQIVLKNVKELEFGFWDENKKAYVTSINELGNLNKNLLRLIRIKLTWVDRDGIERKFEKSFRPLWPHYKALSPTEEANKSSLPSAPGVPTDNATGSDDGKS